MVSAIQSPAPISASHEQEAERVHDHAVAVIVGVFAALVFGEILDRRRRAPARAPAFRRGETQHAVLGIGGGSPAMG